VNLTDPVFRGVHRGRRKHEGLHSSLHKRAMSNDENKDDFEVMLERSRAAGVKSMVITGGSLKESKQALELAKKYGW
jgi:TatD DNase family protein